MKSSFSSMIAGVCDLMAVLSARGSAHINAPLPRSSCVLRSMRSLLAVLAVSSMLGLPSPLKAEWTTPPPSTAITGQTISVTFLYSPSSWTTATVWVQAPGSSTWTQCGGGGGTIGGTISGSGGYGFTAAGTHVMKAVGGSVASGTVIAGPSSIVVTTANHPPAGSMNCPSSLTTGQSFTVSASASDVDGDLSTLGIRWQGYGLQGGDPGQTWWNISGSQASRTTPSLTAPSTPGPIYFRAEVWDGANNSYTGPWVSIQVNAPPTITTHPQGQTVNVGGSASFSVAASGSAPFSYQWRKNGSNISGATSSSYSITNVQTSHAGGYSVVVTNSAGSATSNSATLTVNAPPTITTHPQSQTVNVGGTASFSVAASGATPFSYQWRKDGSNISGATSSSYSITNVQTSHAGGYSVVVTNSAGSAASNSVTLTVNAPPAPAITSPLTASGTVGTAFTYQITASNSPTNFGATPLPSGLSVNSSTGLISGTPSTAGSPNVTLSATNASGTGTAVLVLTVSTGTLASPSVLPATSITASGFTANWSAVAGATGYRLDVSTSSAFGTFVTGFQDRDVGNTTSFAVTGLTANTVYYYRVRAVNASSTSASSNTASVTTSATNPNADDDGDGILNGVEQQLGTTGHTTTPDSGDSTQLKVHKP